MAELSDEELLEALGEEVEAPKAGARSAREERIIAGFEDIQRFFETHGRAPRHGEGLDIFERLYAVRLDRIRAQADCRELCAPLDHQGLLAMGVEPAASTQLNDDALLAELGEEEAAGDDISVLKYVRSRAEIKAAEEIANREVCKDFAQFKPLFAQVQKELDEGVRQTRPFEMKAEIEVGRYFILKGQKAYVAEKGDVFTTDQGRLDARLRVIFDNGTEIRMLWRSLQRALNKDDTGRRITEPSAGPLFADEAAEGDQESGTIYVLRSKTEHPDFVANRDVIHKIGVTGGDLAARIAGARNDATYLLADVEVVATYELFNINRRKLEQLLHRVFDSARLDFEIKDRFGIPFKPREWFVVPLFVIDEAVSKIREGTIGQYRYDHASAKLVAEG